MPIIEEQVAPQNIQIEVRREYECDILFKKISVDQVAYRFRRWIASKEAVARLPLAFRYNNHLLWIVLMGCGNKSCGFEPEMLHSGWWILSDYGYEIHEALVSNKSNRSRYYNNQSEGILMSFNDVVTVIKKEVAGTHYILHDGLVYAKATREWQFHEGEMQLIEIQMNEKFASHAIPPEQELLIKK